VIYNYTFECPKGDGKGSGFAFYITDSTNQDNKVQRIGWRRFEGDKWDFAHFLVCRSANNFT
jgi:hypothetical protein